MIASCATKPVLKIEKPLETITKIDSIKFEEQIRVVLADSLKTYKDSVINSLKETLTKEESVPLQNGIDTQWTGTTNFNLRKPNFIIIHHTAQDSLAQTIKTFTLVKTKVSAHYVIADDGRVVQMLNDYLRAWHGGNSSWGKNTDINSASIGIELDNNGSEPFSEPQITSLMALIAKLKYDYNIPTQNIIGHSDIAPTRKYDPSALFPWKILAEKEFGIWPDAILEPAPVNFNVELALRIIGYDTKNLPAAIAAFKLHYIQTEVDSVLDEKTINTIYNIYTKQ
ncbi:N-acetylmuramoyl-L-alanine amidase [Flavobacterium sp.]|uniref:N-acetylmuramoyl-L-alanine amidase n=1 Tax=Flavobacterium sp. TaxID=239 RepID=UPI00286ADAC0|nr:N-acetylmuramoyl-L-alanine amidase [Flavobacterium sp.]